MLNTNDFLIKLIDQGFSHLCVVPCSFAKNIINASINQGNKIVYTPCASEAVACSVAAGLTMGGKKPIVIVQSSGLTNLGSCITSLLKPYDVKFPIIVSWRTYQDGDSEVQHQHLSSNLPSLVNAYGYEAIKLINNDLDIAIDQINQCNISKKICLMEKDSFTKVDLLSEHILDLSNYIKRSFYLKKLNEIFANEDVLFIGTTGNTSREMYGVMPDTNNFYMAGNMGGALSLGLGAALSGKKVIVCGGDAEFVMHMGGLTTAGRYKKDINLHYILFDNESNKSTGGQQTLQNHVNYSIIAQNLGFDSQPSTITNIEEFLEIFKNSPEENKLLFTHVKCSYDDQFPRPPINEVAKNCFDN